MPRACVAPYRETRGSPLPGLDWVYVYGRLWTGLFDWGTVVRAIRPPVGPPGGPRRQTAPLIS